jgi:hypothetical protein
VYSLSCRDGGEAETNLRYLSTALVGFTCLTLVSAALADAPLPRARDLGVPFDGSPGTNNAITDVPGVEVGFKTLISKALPALKVALADPSPDVRRFAQLAIASIEGRLSQPKASMEASADVLTIRISEDGTCQFWRLSRRVPNLASP